MTLKLFRVVGAVALGAALMGSQPGSAFAQTAEQKNQAREHFQNARRLYDVGRYADAIEEYQKAYLNVEDPVFLYNIAQAHRLNNQRDEAIRFYKNYLRRAPAAANRSEVETKIREMEKEIADGKTGPGGPNNPPPPPNNTVVPPPPPPNNTVVPPNNTVVPPPNNTVVPPPNNTVVPPPNNTVVPPPGDGTGAVGTDANLVGHGEPPSSGGNHGLAYGLLIGSGVGIAVAAICGAVANSKANDVEMAPVFDPAVQKSGKAFNAAAIAFGVLGGVSGAIGLYLLFFGDDAGAKENPAVARSGSSRVAFFPTLAPGYAGAGARVSF